MAQAYLGSAFYARRRLSVLDGRLEQLRSVAERITAAPTEEPGGSAVRHDPMAEAASKAADLSQRIQQQQIALLAAWENVSLVIDAVADERQRELLDRRYLQYQRWRQIEREMSYSERGVFRLHAAALSTVISILKYRETQRVQ